MNGESEHTGRHELPGGVEIGIPDATAKQWSNLWAIFVWLVKATAIVAGVAGWILRSLGK